MEKRTEQILPVLQGEWRGWETGGRDSPNNVCTYLTKKRKIDLRLHVVALVYNHSYSVGGGGKIFV
jgi:hypothetical protein